MAPDKEVLFLGFQQVDGFVVHDIGPPHISRLDLEFAYGK